jgi:hypothetical protein
MRYEDPIVQANFEARRQDVAAGAHVVAQWNEVLRLFHLIKTF